MRIMQLLLNFTQNIPFTKICLCYNHFMNKQNTIIIIILLLLGAVGIYLLVSNAPRQEKVSEESTQESTQSKDEELDVVGDDGAKDEDEKLEIDIFENAPKNAVFYEVNESEVRFVANKRLFESPNQDITGYSSEIEAGGWFDFNTNTFSMFVTLNSDDFEIDDESLEDDFSKMLNYSDISVFINVEDEEDFIIDEEINLQIPATVTINNVTRNEIFEVDTTVTESSFEASGKTNILMSDYEIQTPGVKDVFTVDDILIIEFDIYGESTNGEETQVDDSEKLDEEESAKDQNEEDTNEEDEEIEISEDETADILQEVDIDGTAEL